MRNLFRFFQLSLGGLSASMVLSSCHSGGTLTASPSETPPAANIVAQPTIAFPAASPHYSRNNSLVISGMCVTGQIVQLSGSDSAQQTCAAAVYSFTVTKTIDGFYSYFITQMNSIDNTSSLPLTMIWFRKSSISLPVVTSPGVTPLLSAANVLTFSGTCETGATVTLSGDGTGSTTCVASAFSLLLPKAIDGDYTLQIAQTDAAGNTASTSIVWKKHALLVSPVNPMLLTGSTQILSLSGGSGSYSVTFTANLSGAAFNSVTGTYTAGTTANVTDIVTVTDSNGMVATTNISVIAGVADHLEFGTPSGNSQVTNIGQALTNPMKVKVVDRYGNGIANFPVYFQLISGDSVLTGGPLLFSDLNGFAQLNMRMGTSSLVTLVRAKPLGAALPDLASSGSSFLDFAETSRSLATGKFGAIFQMGPNPGQIITGDFNGDGKLDAAVLSVGDNSVNLFLGKGNFLFENFSRLRPICTGPNGLTAGDFNNDGKLDIAVICSGSDTYSILLGNGSGGFAAAFNTVIGPAETLPTSIATADFNNDGNLDLAITVAGGAVVGVRFGAGNGTFGPATEYAVGQSPNSIIAKDINNDGKPDLAVVNTNDNSVSVLINTGTGSFLPQAVQFVGNSPIAIEINDVNADGFKDLIVLNNTDGTVSILLADGLGGFAAPITAPVGASPTSLVVADFNGDGKPDIAATANGDNSVSILYGAGTGVFSSGPAISTIGSPIAIAMGDLNNDGKIDILLDGSATEALQVLPGRPNGIFGFLNSMSAEPIASVAADFNEDGKVDLAVLNTDAKIDVLLGNGQGLFTSGSQLSANTGPSAIAVADLNNDGHQDLVVLNRVAGTARVFLGVGNGTFGPFTDFVVGADPTGIVIRDADNDQFLDFLVVNTATNRINFLHGNGDGTFGANIGFATASDPSAIVASDFNNDKKIDIAVTSRTTATVSILIGNGNGSFQSHIEYPTGNIPSSLIAEDLNNDGQIDLAVANENDGTISIILGNGDGSFRSNDFFSAGVSPSSIITGDFNGDGKIDLAVANKAASTFAILFGSANGLFNTSSVFTLDGTPNRIGTGDFNGDGAIDISVLNGSGQKLNIWLGH